MDEYMNRYLKRTKQKSIVLEQQENIDIKQYSTGFSKRKSTLVRERFYSRPQNTSKCFKHQEDISKQQSPKANIGIAKTLVLEEDQQEKFEQGLYDISYQLANLEKNINNDIEKFQEEGMILLNSKKLERNSKQKKKYQSSTRQEETWSEHLKDNSRKEKRKDDKQTDPAKERFSLQYQCISISPRYAENKDLAIRPRTRTLGSPLPSKNMCLDQGAVGDHNSQVNLKLKNVNKVKDSKEMLNACLQRNLGDMSIAKNDHTVNCCLCTIENPLTNCADAHQKYQQTYADGNWEEYYYDCENCKCTSSQCARNYREAATPSNQIRRQRTDLDTENFYCRRIDRWSSPQPRNVKNAKRKPKETFSGSKEGHEEHKSCKKTGREKLKEQTYKQQTSQLQEKNKKIRKNIEKRADKISKISDDVDRYVEDRADDSRSTHVPHVYETHSSFKLESEINQGSYYNVAMQPQYSSKTLLMLKKMKILEYKPIKPKESVDENNKESHKINVFKGQERGKNYQQYLEKFSRERNAKKSITILKEPSKTLSNQESETPDFYKQAAQRSRRDHIQNSKEQDFRTDGTQINFAHNEIRPQAFESIAKNHIHNYSHVEDNTSQEPQTYKELKSEYDATKDRIESREDQIRKYNQVFCAHVKFNSENKKLCCKDYKRYKMPESSQDYTDASEEENFNENNSAKPNEQGPIYDRHQYKDTLEQEQPQVAEPSNKIYREFKYEREKESESDENYAAINKKFKEPSYHHSQNYSDSNVQGQQQRVKSPKENFKQQLSQESVHEQVKEISYSIETNGQQEVATVSKETKLITSKLLESETYTLREENEIFKLPTNSREYIFKPFDGLNQKSTSQQKNLRQHTLNPFDDSQSANQIFKLLQKPPERTLKLFDEVKQKCISQQEKPIFKLQEESRQQTLLKLFDEVEETSTTKREKQIFKLAENPRQHTLIFSDGMKQNSHSQQQNEILRMSENPEKYTCKNFDEMKQIQQLSSNNDFNFSICIDRSSQTESTLKPELIERNSKETITEQISAINAKNDYQLYVNSVEDLITKFSSCKSLLLTNQALISQENFADLKKSSEGEIINTDGDKLKQNINEDKDLASTPESSNFQFKQQAEAEENLSAFNENSGNKTRNYLISNESNEQEVLESLQIQKDKFIENCNIKLLNQENSQTSVQQLKTFETDHSKASLHSLTSGEAFHNERQTAQIELINECCELHTKSPYLYRESSSCSRQTVFDSELPTLKGILKSCHLVEIGQDQNNFLNTQRASSVTFNQQQECVAQRESETMESFATKDVHSIWKQDNLTDATSRKQQTICQDYHRLETKSFLGNSSGTNSATSYAVVMPAFKQCPCMWRTYVEMMTNVYKGKTHLLIES